MKARLYQQEIVNELNATDENRCVSLATGGGKTFVFSYFSREHLQGKKTLILVHREELLEQSYQTLLALGLYAQKIDGKTKKIDYSKEVYVAMSLTLESRFKKNPNYITDIQTVIIDECHHNHYSKLLPNFEGARLIGFTATPVTMKKDFKLSDIFTNLIEGVDISELIKQGALCKDVCYHLPLKPEDFQKLKKSDSNGGYTGASMNAVFNQGLLIEECYNYYQKYLKGKKTMIFCCSTQHMEETTKFFQNKGINARSYGSKSEANRAETVKWIKENEDAVLISLDIFTAGFDVKDILGIILFRATTSLSLYLQIVGRGARITDKIYKDHFTVIDFGNNIERFGLWSSPRDWKSYFFKTKKKKEGTAPIRECPNCGRINHATAKKCDECEYEFPKSEKEELEAPEDVKVVKTKDFEFPEVDVQRLLNFCDSKGWKPPKSLYLLIEANLRILTVYDITPERLERDWQKILPKIWEKVETQISEFSKLTDTKHDLKYWKKQMLIKVLDHYEREELILKDYGKITRN